jgi:CBS domain-containing protein
MKIRNAHLESAHTVATSTSIVDVARVLRDKKLRHVFVLDAKEFPIGVVSISDINGKVVAEGKSPASLSAGEIMSSPLHMMEIDNEVSKAYFEMIGHGSLSVPIVDNGLLVGVLSMNEALKHMVKEQRERRGADAR